MTGESLSLRALGRVLGSSPRQSLEIPGYRSAAVLVPLLEAEDGFHLLFTVRASHLANHASQIAFPGGAVEPGEDIASAALREAAEEVGLEVAAAAVLGFLDDHPSPARYVATPVVARVPWPSPLRINAQEVEEVFTVPLAALRTLAPRAEERILNGHSRTIHYYQWEQRLIWGFTGNVLKDFLDRAEQARPGRGSRR